MSAQPWAQQDIRLWFAYHDGKCPNCGLDMKSCHPLYNIYPHWAGNCKEDQVAATSASSKGAGNERP